MSRKDFVALAARLKAMRPAGENTHASQKAKNVAAGRLDQWREMVKGMADFCQSQSERFDRERFLTACGLD